MKAVQIEITESLNSYLTFLERDGAYFRSPFHNHPELELVYIREGYGKRIIGNNIEEFEAGDLVFIGSNLPHVWLSDETFYANGSSGRSRAIVIYFNKDIFGKAFYDLKEAYNVIDFFNRSERGIAIKGETGRIVAAKLEELLLKKNFERIIALFEILHILSITEDYQYILSNAALDRVEGNEADRLADVYRYLKEHYSEDINLNKIAKIANLTPQSFCRLFKRRTGHHFVEYLTKIRIDKSCKMLMETDKTISEIAYSCGFKTVSNFNKLFKELNHKNPKAFRFEIGHTANKGSD